MLLRCTSWIHHGAKHVKCSSWEGRFSSSTTAIASLIRVAIQFGVITTKKLVLEMDLGGKMNNPAAVYGGLPESLDRLGV